VVAQGLAPGKTPIAIVHRATACDERPMTGDTPHRPGWRNAVRLALVALYLAAGVLHLVLPAPFLRITPAWVPNPALVVSLTGLAELAGAIGLLQGRFPALRRAAGLGLAAYALGVWPANINHLLMDLARPDHGLGWAYHGPRMLAQPLLIWAALWAGGVIGKRAGARRSA
jgi:uncharacterized membrane protein